MKELITILHNQNCSCVISNGSNTLICNEKGVKDLLRLLTVSPEMLKGAMVADKVIGKGAAALMILGGVSEIYADVISNPALSLLNGTDIKVSYNIIVQNIINRSGTGICPVESLCSECVTPEECLPLITNFINSTKCKQL